MYITPEVRLEDGSFPPFYFPVMVILLCCTTLYCTVLYCTVQVMVLVFCLHRAAHYACFVSMVAFCTRLSDPAVGAVETASRPGS